MLLAHDTVAGLILATDVVNTGARGADVLRHPIGADPFRKRHALIGQVALTQAEADELLTLRAKLRAAWHTSENEQLVHIANKLLGEAHARPRLINHDNWGWHFHVTGPDAPLHDRIAAQAGMALADLVKMDEKSRLKTCAAPDCDAVLIDLSRNRSRRYCDTGNCANRLNVAAYRARARR